jgi:hypothetical protein
MNLQSPRIPTRSKKEKAIDFDLNQISSSLDTINSSGYTEIVINISSVQIKALGSVPVVFLPAPGSNKYYEYKIICEFTYGTVQYSLNDLVMIGGLSSYGGTNFDPIAITYADNTVFCATNNTTSQQSFAGSGQPEQNRAIPLFLNEAIGITTYNGTDPILGDGTIRAKISYKEITFGS